MRSSWYSALRRSRISRRSSCIVISFICFAVIKLSLLLCLLCSILIVVWYSSLIKNYLHRWLLARISHLTVSLLILLSALYSFFLSLVCCVFIALLILLSKVLSLIKLLLNVWLRNWIFNRLSWKGSIFIS